MADARPEPWPLPPHSEDAAWAIAEKFGVPYVAVRDFKIAADTLGMLDAGFAVANRVLPLYRHDGVLVVATENPFDSELVQRLRFLTDMAVVPVMASGEQVAERRAKEYPSHAPQPGEAAPQLAALLPKEIANAGTPILLGEAPGCPACHGTGYRGRLAIHELLSADAHIGRLIQSRAPVEEVLRAAVSGGMTTLMQDGILKILQGLTDVRQVRSACS